MGSMKKYIIIEADTNDGDYTTNKSEITDEQIELIKPMVEAIKNFKPYKVKVPGKMEWTHDYNFPTGECVREDLGQLSAEDFYKDIDNFDVFDEFVPYGENGIHTIESIDILIVAEEIKLL